MYSNVFERQLMFLFIFKYYSDPFDKQTDFTFSTGTEVSGSCSVVWQDRMFVFGGYSQHYQISQVEKCQLKLVGQLDLVTADERLRMFRGQCTNVANKSVFICSPDTNDEPDETYKYCFKAVEPLAKFYKTRDSKYFHRETRIGNDGGMLDLSITNHYILFQK